MLIKRKLRIQVKDYEKGARVHPLDSYYNCFNEIRITALQKLLNEDLQYQEDKLEKAKQAQNLMDNDIQTLIKKHRDELAHLL